MQYCLVTSVGYGVAVFALWETLALVGSAFYGAPLWGIIALGLPIALGAFAVGAVLNCFFQSLGSVLGLDPQTSLTVGWAFVLALAALPQVLPFVTSSDPLEFAKGAYLLATSSANTFPASKVFYTIGNYTLTLLAHG